MGQKDKKAKAAEKKARVAAKQNSKAAKKEKKGKTKGGAEDDSDAEDEDLESVLAQYAKQQAQFLKVTETLCPEPPSSRTSATLIGSPSNPKELLLFGGECFDGAVASFFNDLFVYNIDRDEWKSVTSPNTPLPRSGHAWCRGGNSGGVYLFGGEFSSPKQGTFYHYNDFWRLEPSTREWTRLESKGKGPPARSGHRMTFYKNYILLFGGFQDTSQQTKYLQDLWIYDCQNYIWHSPSLAQKPDARSSFSFLPHDSGAVLYGGYSRVKANTTSGGGGGGGNKSKGGGGGGGNSATKSTMKPVVHQDAWFLRFAAAPPDAAPGAAPNVRWERRKKPTNSPNPPRAGATQAYHKGRGLMFGGVHDVEESEEGIDSEFFNDLFVWNIERNRFFPLSLKRARTTTGKRQQQQQQQSGDDRDGRRGGGGRAKADEAELLRNLAALETKGSIAEADKMDLDEPAIDDEVDMPAKPVKPVLNTFPHARFNAQLAVQGDVLYILGGTFEQGDREITFAEMHAIDMGKLDGVTEIYRREPENWKEEVESESDSDEDEEDYDDDVSKDGMDEDDTDQKGGVALQNTEPVAETPSKPSAAEGGADEEEEPASTPLGDAARDGRPYPRPFESLRDFFARTSQTWQELVLAEGRESRQGEGATADQSVKELRKVAFVKSESMWWDCREEITAEEDRQEEAGIGEIVSLEARAGLGAGAGGSPAVGRRR